MAERPRYKVFRDRKGRWAAQAYLGRDEVTGRARRPYRTLPQARSPGEAARMAEEWLDNMDGSLADQLWTYVDTLEANGAAPNTVKVYRGYVRNHVARLLPRAAPAELSAADITAFERRLMQGERPLSRNTVSQLHWFLVGAYRFFCSTLGTVARNPMPDVAHPSRVRREARVLDGEELARVAGWIGDALHADGATGMETTLAVAAWEGLYLGLRVGEACAVRRQDVSASRRSVSVNATVVELAGGPWRQPRPKTSHSRRNVSVGGRSMSELDTIMAREEDRLGPLPAGTPIATPDGLLVRPSEVSRAFSAKARELGLEGRVGFHALRHTHAAHLLASGVDARTVQERLGHSDVRTTLALYGHVLPGRDAAAADAFDRIASGAEDE